MVYKVSLPEGGLACPRNLHKSVTHSVPVEDYFWPRTPRRSNVEAIFTIFWFSTFFMGSGRHPIVRMAIFIALKGLWIHDESFVAGPCNSASRGLLPFIGVLRDCVDCKNILFNTAFYQGLGQ